MKLHSSVTNEGLQQGMKYVVYKQPLSLDRFFIHEVSAAEANMAKLENAFILINLNRFQQIVSVQTFQAESEQLKVMLMITHCDKTQFSSEIFNFYEIVFFQ